MPRERHDRVLLLGETTGTASVGLLYLTSFLRRNGIEAHCQWHDENRTREALKENITRLISRLKPTLVGVSMKWFPHMARCVEICKLVKEISPRTKVVIGGNTASYFWNDFLKEPWIDYVIRGDGEVPLLALCQGESVVPNLAERKDGSAPTAPSFDYKQDVKTPDIYLSHLDSMFTDPTDPQRCASFFIYTGKRCNKKCFYCGGAATAMHFAFGSARPFFRTSEDVQNDVQAVLEHNKRLFFDFDFEPEGKTQEEYFREVFTSKALKNCFAYFAFWRLPEARTIEFLAQTFGSITLTLDLASLSEKHRDRLMAEPGLGVKPQPKDEQILDIFAQADRHDHFTVDINLIASMPLLELQDLDDSMRMVRRLVTEFKSLEGLQWGLLHAQPGAPIVDRAENFGMLRSAKTYQDFMTVSLQNLDQETYPDWRRMVYPYLRPKDSVIWEASLQHFVDVNKFLMTRDPNRKKQNVLY